MTALIAAALVMASSCSAQAASAERGFLLEVARETWRYFVECRDKNTHLVWDHSGDARKSAGTYTGPTNIAMDLGCTLAAMDLGIITREDAQDRIRQVLDTLDRLTRYRGFYYNFYDTATLEPRNRFLSFVDNGWLGLALIAVRQEFPGSPAEAASGILKDQDYSFFYDRKAGLMYHGFHTDRRGIRYGHYSMFCSEPRGPSLLAICKGDVPEQHWFRMERARPAEGKGYTAGEKRTYSGVEVQESFYRYGHMKIVPSWGGSMFEFLMPTLFIDEQRYARESLARNNRSAVDAQIAYANECGMPVWGMSPCAVPAGGYSEYGADPIGVEGYASGVATPHASFLALESRPAEALENLRKMQTMYAMRGSYGFRDSVDTKTGQVSDTYLALDQGMTLIAIDNYLNRGAIRRRVMRDPLMKQAPSILSQEVFY